MPAKLPAELSRKDLYDLVWAEPMTVLAKQFELSDTGLAKICRASDVPLPYRGYWAKVASGKAPTATPLPERGLGRLNTVQVRGHYWSYGFNFLNFVVPDFPSFEKGEGEVIESVKLATKKAKIARTLAEPHHLIRRLLELDSARAEKARGQVYSWTKPYFDTRFEKRRLKILNSIFSMAQSAGFKPEIDMRKARTHSIIVGDQRVGFDLETVSVLDGRNYSRHGQDLDISGRTTGDPMRLKIDAFCTSQSYASVWQDGKESKLEDHLREIFEAFVFHGEMNVRHQIISHHQWLKERVEDASQKELERLAEAERQRVENIRKLEQLRLDTLVTQAEDLRKAEAIRNYIDKSRLLLGELSADDIAAFEVWVAWSLIQADRIDPVKNRLFLVPEPQMQ